MAADACILAFDDPEPPVWARVAGDATDIAAVTATDVLRAFGLKTGKR